MTSTTDDKEIEEVILKESIVSAAGINAASLQIGIRGDPSMRETTGERKRYNSEVDEQIDALIPSFEEILLNRSTYQLFVGFNNGEIRTNSVFDPMVQEIHSADKMADATYIARQFPAIAYEEKVDVIRESYISLREQKAFKNLPSYWQNIMHARAKNWEPMEREEIETVITTLKTLREMPTYYMRNITINVVQSMVRIQFNCDGTQIVSAENYKQFLEENM